MKAQSAKHKEIEMKYNADSISIDSFKAFCLGREPLEYIVASGWDYFYAHKTEKDSFCRLRNSADLNQLTFKRKLTEKNNYIRAEHNIDMQHSVKQDQVEALVNEFGYVYNMALFKNCFIYNYEWYTLVYYIVYNEAMREVGRFIEIEMDEAKDWKDTSEAYKELTILEKLCKPLGLNSKERVSLSLFELYRKEIK